MKVEIVYIIVGLALGLFIVYALTPPPKVILKYPTIDNIASTTYVDERGQCYRYFAREIPCPNKQSVNPQ